MESEVLSVRSDGATQLRMASGPGVVPVPPVLPELMLLVVLALEVKSSEELHAVSSRIKARANRRLIKVECDQVAFMVYPKKVIISIVFVWDHLSRLTESQMQQIHTDYWFYYSGEINMTGSQILGVYYQNYLSKNYWM